MKIEQQIEMDKQITDLLVRKGELETTEISRELRLNPETISKYLKKLIEDKKLEERRMAMPNAYYYRINHQIPIFI